MIVDRVRFAEAMAWVFLLPVGVYWLTGSDLLAAFAALAGMAIGVKRYWG